MTDIVVIEQADCDGAASTVSSVGVKDSQNIIKLVVDMGDKGTIEIPLTGKLVVHQQQNSDSDLPPEDTDQMRGWMMTVATLFVTLAYQAVMQPPGWMPKGDWLRVEINSYKKHYGTTTGASSSSHADRPAMPAPSPSPPAITVHQARLADAYVFLNTFTFRTALSLLIVLLLLKKNPPPTHIMLVVKIYVVVVACTVASTFVLGISDEPSIQKWVSLYLVLNTALTISYVIGLATRWVLFIGKKICSTRGLQVR